MVNRMHNSSDLVAYAATGISVVLAGSGQVDGLAVANGVVELLMNIIGLLSGLASLIYFVWKWKDRRVSRKSRD